MVNPAVWVDLGGEIEFDSLNVSLQLVGKSTLKSMDFPRLSLGNPMVGHGSWPPRPGRGLAQERQTAIAMAHRVDEALTRGSTVLVADIGRPNRKARSG